jgi:hypothetical protein
MRRRGAATAVSATAPDKANVHSQAPVPPAAFQAHEDAVRYGGPLRVLGLAVHADLAQAEGEQQVVSDWAAAGLPTLRCDPL